MRFALYELQKADWKQVRAIYAEGLATGLAAFMTSPPLWKAFNATHLPLGRVVARDGDGDILGWAALAPVPDT